MPSWSSRSGSRSCSGGWSSATAATAGRTGPGARAGAPARVRPEPWPANPLFAMRAATFAKQTGRPVSFALAAFRQAFAAGRDMTEHDNVLISAAACELHPNAVSKACGTESVKRGLIEATDRAAELGVIGVPSLVVGGEVFWGDDRVEEAV